MTNQEAIIVLKSVERYGIEAEAVNLAIDALEQYDSMAETINKASELLRKKRPQGEWKVYGKQGGIPITDMCSNCRYEMKWYKDKYNFCPNCGARMSGGGIK